MGLTPLVALALIGVAVVAVFRGLDVRLVLSVAALALAALGGDVRPVVQEFLGTFSNEKFVVPTIPTVGIIVVLHLRRADRAHRRPEPDYEQPSC